jgi:hypothetical protein
MNSIEAGRTTLNSNNKDVDIMDRERRQGNLLSARAAQ